MDTDPNYNYSAEEDTDDQNTDSTENHDQTLDYNNINFYSIEKELNRRGSLIKTNDIFYIKVDRPLASKNQSLKFSKNKQNNIFKHGSNQNLDNDNESTTKSIDNKSQSSASPKKTNWLKLSKEKSDLNGYIDVSIEKLQQHFAAHILAMSIKNFRVEPLIEINYIKSNLTYLTVEMVETTKKAENNDKLDNNDSSGSVEKNYKNHKSKKKKLFAKIIKNKTIKCKFDANGKNFVKPVEFELHEEHFINVTNEAANLQLQKLSKSNSTFAITSDLFGNKGDNAAKDTKKYLFLFSIEIHSYLPISRKTLSSTFRKKKRIFKGHCQIYENFVRNTQFTKKFQLIEV